jgi:hypothetical protein
MIDLDNYTSFPYSIHVPWPEERTMRTVATDESDDDEVEFRTCDPNEIMRPELELLGEQGVAWNWQISQVLKHGIEVFFMDATEAIKFKLLWS